MTKKKKAKVLSKKTRVPARPVTKNESTLDILHDLSAAIASSQSMDAVCENILGFIVRALKVEKASIMKFDSEAGVLKIIAAKGLSADVIRDARITVGEGISGGVFASNKPLLVKDIRSIKAGGKSKYKTKSLISAPVTCFPMHFGKKPVGVVNVTDKRGGAPFTEADMRLLTTISNQVAAYFHLIDMLDEVRRADDVRREIEIARDIQHSLLPHHPPKIDGLEADGVCLMAEKVGGDYYDYLVHRWAPPAFVVADVSGHTIGSALLMAAFRSSLRVEGAMPLLSPAMVVERLNTIMYPDLLHSDNFITMAFLQILQGEGTARYVTAGHPPILHYQAKSGHVSELSTGDLFLGLEAGTHYHEERVAIEKGDVFLLYTDGVTEAKDKKGVCFGRERLRAIFKKSVAAAPTKIIDAITSRVNDYVGGAVKDDVTMLVVRVKG